MAIKNKKRILIQRIFIWIIYLFSGFILYLKNGYLYLYLIYFARVVYPLSIFWLQIRIKRKNNFFPIDSSMSTSQLWFNILPVLACLFAVIFTITNALFFILKKLN